MKYKHVIVFVLVVFIASIITGIIYGINNYYDLSDYINTLNKHNNVFIKDIIILLFFLFSTISLLGIFIQSIYIGFEGLSVGYIISEFYLNYKFKGIVYSIINIIINKLLFLLILLYLFFITYKYTLKIISNIVGNSNDYIKNIIKPLIKKYILIFFFLLIIDTIIYFFGNLILNYFTFML